MSKKNKKIGLYIDYANLLSSCRKIGKKINFKKLVKFIETEFEGELEFKSIYFAYPEDNTRDYDVSGMHKFSHFLAKEVGFHMKKKPLKQITIRDVEGKIILDDNSKPIIKEKGNLDIELAMDVMQTWSHFDKMVLFSGDSDFQCLTDFLIWKKKKVYIFSTKGQISNELRIHSTKYYDIAELPKKIFAGNLYTKDKQKTPT